MGAYGLKDKIFMSLFHAVTPRTAGFNIVNTGSLTMGTLVITIVYMFIGGGSGSTAGGIKISTFGVLFLKNIAVIKGKKDVEYKNRRIGNDVVDRAIAITFISASWVFGVVMILCATEKFTLLEIVFETVLCLWNSGTIHGYNITTKYCW